MQTKKEVLCRDETLGRLSDATLVVDSTALIDASKCPAFMDFMAGLVDTGCTLVTVPSALYEFKRGARNLEQLNAFNEIINDLEIQTIQHIEERAQEKDGQIFTSIYNVEAVANRKEKGPSYTDSLLCLVMYLYRHVNIKLLTTNYRDIPESLFTKTDIMAYDTGREIRTAAFYGLDKNKLARKLQNMESQSGS